MSGIITHYKRVIKWLLETFHKLPVTEIRADPEPGMTQDGKL